MHISKMAFCSFLSLLLLGSLAASAEEDYIRNAAEIVKAADWEKMQTVRVELDEFEYNPGDLTFSVGVPYKLELINKGEQKHYFTAPEFYKSIATRKVQSNKDGEIKAPYFTAIELMVGGQLDVYFVPVKSGTYPVYCTVDKHREDGMEGSIIVK